MWRGREVDGPTFYRLLSANNEFCAELGRATLAAGRLETALKRCIASNPPSTDLARATLGRLITYASKHSSLGALTPVLESLLDQRNNLTHNVHAVLHGLIEETILEASNLLDSDVHTYTERAWLLAENLNGIAEILEETAS